MSSVNSNHNNFWNELPNLWEDIPQEMDYPLINNELSQRKPYLTPEENVQAAYLHHKAHVKEILSRGDSPEVTRLNLQAYFDKIKEYALDMSKNELNSSGHRFIISSITLENLFNRHAEIPTRHEAGALALTLNYIAHQQDLNCCICVDIQEFHNSLNDLLKSDFEGKFAFLVLSARKPGERNDNLHLSPVLIEKSKDQTLIMIADAVSFASLPKKLRIITPNHADWAQMQKLVKGESFSYEYKTPRSADEVDELLTEFIDLYSSNDDDDDVEEALDECYYAIDDIMFEQMQMQNLYTVIRTVNASNVTIFISNVQRQNSEFGCSAFAFKDVQYFFKNSEFFSELQQKGNLREHETDSNLKYVNVLPPSMMKITQSMRVLELYTQKQLEMYNQDPNSAYLLPTTANLVSSRYLWNVKGKIQNHKITHAVANHRFIVAKSLQYYSLNQINNIIKQFDSSSLHQQINKRKRALENDQANKKLKTSD